MTRFQGVVPVFRREFKSYFSSPLGYVFIVIFLLASGYLTVSRDFGRFLEIRQANLDAFFAFVPWIFVVLVPAVAMRLWAEERKSGTIEFLLTLPISLEGAYVGKFLAGWIFISFSLLLTWPVIYQVGRLGDPDWGVILTGYVGCVLAAGAFLSVGMLFSVVSKNQVVALILGVAASTSFLLLGLPETLDYVGGALGGYPEHVLQSLSLIDHFESLTRGLVELRSLAFFTLFTIGWLAVGMLTLRETKGN